MSGIELSKIWPDWEYAGYLGEGPFGKVYLAKSTLDGNPIYSTVKVVKVPAGSEALQAAMKLGISEDLLYTYFGKFKNDLNWELTMFKSASSNSLVGYDEVTLIDNAGQPGWTGYIRSGLFTPMKDYFAKSRSTADDAVRMGMDIAEAVSVCGAYGMVHGGICPENIMLTDSGSYVLKDFGVRRCLKRAGSSLFTGLTDEFDAPEVIDGGKYSHVSDIYSLGMCIMYVAAGGRLPESRNPDDIPDLSYQLKEVIKRAIATQPEYRYQSAEDLRSDLERIQIEDNKIRRAAAVALALETVGKNGSGATKTEEKVDYNKNYSEDSRPVKKKGGRKAGAIVALLLVCAVVGSAVYVLKPWESGQTQKDPGSAVDTPDDDDRVSAGIDDILDNDGDQTIIPDDGDDKTNPDGTDKDNTDEDKDPGQTTTDGDDDKDDDTSTTGVTPDQIRLVQKYLGVTADGDWGPKSKEAAGGLTAEAAYKAYLNGTLAKPETPSEGGGSSTSGVTVAQIKEVQKALGVTADGVWGSKSTAAAGGLTAEEAYKAYKNGTLFSGNSNVAVGNVKKMQALLGVTADGIWGPKSSAACGGLTVEEAYKAYLNGTLKKVDGGSSGSEDDDYVRKTQPYRDITILPSNEREITYADLEGMTSEETYMVINEIYARHGKIFTSASIQEYFESMYWYEPKTFDSNKVVSQFSALEEQNMHTVVAYQKEMGYR